MTTQLLEPIPVVAPPVMALKRVRSDAARLRRRARTLAHRNPSDGVSHSSLEAFFRSRPSGDSFGDNPQSSDPRLTWILFQNVHGIPLELGDEKQKGLFQGWRDEKVGIALLAEMNLNWDMVRPGHKWFDRVRFVARRGHYSTVAHYRHQEIPSAMVFQWGGCSATLLDQVSHSARSSGADPSGLGRWAWVKLRGRSQPSSTTHPEEEPLSVSRDLVVVSAYRPNRPSQYAGSVWNVQRNYWLDKGLDVNPHEKFTEDLLEEVEKWRAAGCEVIVGLDANKDVLLNHPGSFRQLLREAGLTEAILSRHHGPYLATQQSNKCDSPIDGIFVSAGVVVRAGGYHEFHKYISSDHRGLWVDIDLWSTLGVNWPAKTFPARRLTMIDERCVRRYVKAAEDGYAEYLAPVGGSRAGGGGQGWLLFCGAVGSVRCHTLSRLCDPPEG